MFLMWGPDLSEAARATDDGRYAYSWSGGRRVADGEGRAGLPFKATAGLHHAFRSTDPGTAFEQHGFLNLITAVDAALALADEASVARLLAERKADVVAEGPRAEGPCRPDTRAVPVLRYLQHRRAVRGAHRTRPAVLH
jgi:hypothetical protein